MTRTPPKNTRTHPTGRLSRGAGRPLDRISIIIPLTASGVIAEDDLAAALTTLLRYAPYAISADKFPPILAAALHPLLFSIPDP